MPTHLVFTKLKVIPIFEFLFKNQYIIKYNVINPTHDICHLVYIREAQAMVGEATTCLSENNTFGEHSQIRK